MPPVFSLLLSVSLSSLHAKIQTPQIGAHFIDKEMNLETLRNLLKATQLEDSRVKNRSYFRGLVFPTTTYCCRT